MMKPDELLITVARSSSEGEYNKLIDFCQDTDQLSELDLVTIRCITCVLQRRLPEIRKKSKRPIFNIH
jgi:hypothetical protein